MRQPSTRSRGPILVVDDDDGFRALICTVLDHLGYPLVEAATGDQALELAGESPPQLVVLDVCLPGISGYQVCHELRSAFGDALPIIFVSGERTQSYDRVAGFLIGGDDYLVKPFVLDEFVARARRLLERQSRLADGPASELTKREVEVLKLLVEGLSQTQVAHRLFISPKTVGTHTERIFKKLGVHNRAQVAAFAYRHALFASGQEPAFAAERAGMPSQPPL
jgi:DNA-binding NarL/FixJ family response regulator